MAKHKYHADGSKVCSIENYADKYPTRAVEHLVVKYRIGRLPDYDMSSRNSSIRDGSCSNKARAR